MDAEYEKLRAKGVAVPADGPITFPFGICNCYIANPEGNLLEIGSDTTNRAGDLANSALIFYRRIARDKTI